MKKDEIEKKRDFLIKQWFHKLMNNQINDTPLLLFDAEESFVFDLRHKLKNYKNVNFSETTCIGVNSIMNLSSETLLREGDFLDRKYKHLFQGKSLFVPKKSKFYTEKFESYFEYDDNDNFDYTPTSNERYLYYIEKLEPYDIVKNYSADELNEFLEFNIEHGFISLLGKQKYDYLLNQIDINIRSNDRFKNDLKMLEKQKILTARMGVLIFRVAENIKATTTAIGRYYYKQTGSRSKTIRVKTSDIITLSKDLIYKGYYKAYNLNVNDSEVAIRKEITKNLINFTNPKGIPSGLYKL